MAKRMNITIIERIRCMLSNEKMPTSFWGEAMETIIAMINLSLLFPLDINISERV
jgi:hypothetical protein